MKKLLLFFIIFFNSQYIIADNINFLRCYEYSHNNEEYIHAYELIIDKNVNIVSITEKMPSNEDVVYIKKNNESAWINIGWAITKYRTISKNNIRMEYEIKEIKDFITWIVTLDLNLENNSYSSYSKLLSDPKGINKSKRKQRGLLKVGGTHTGYGHCELSAE